MPTLVADNGRNIRTAQCARCLTQRTPDTIAK